MAWPRHTPLVLVLLVLSLGIAAGAENQSPLTGDKENAKWKVEDGSATFGGEKVGYRGPTLVFSKAKLADKPLLLKFKCDGDQLTIRSGYRRAKIQFADPSQEQTVLIDLAGQAIQVNGKTTDDLNKDWQRMLEKDEATIELNFEKSKQVTLRWEPGKSITAASDTDGVELTELGPLAIREKLRRAVFPIRARIGDTQIYRSGLGTVVSDEGDVLLPLDLVQGASTKLEMIVGKEAVSMVLRKIDTLHNLGLARLDAGSGLWRPIVKPLTPFDKEPVEGQEVITVDWSRKVGLKTNKHKVVEIDIFGEIDRDWQRLIRAPETSRWIVTDTNPTLGCGGAPLIDKTGRLIGLSYWTWPQREDGSVFLAGSQLHAFLSEDTDKGMEPKTIEALLRNAELPNSGFPRLRIPADQRTTELRKPLALLKNQAACPLCKGKGEVHRSIIRGYKTTGNLKIPIAGTELYVCPRCEGKCYNEIDVLQRILEQAVLAVAQTDTDQPDYQRTAELLVQTLEEVGAVDPESFQERVNQFNAERFSQKKITPGEVVLFIGRPERSELSRHSPDLHLVSLSTRSRSGGFSRSVLSRRSRGPSVLLNEPKLVGEGRAALVLVGGVYAGMVQIGSDDRMPVLQGGIVVEVKEPEDDDRPHRSYRD